MARRPGIAVAVRRPAYGGEAPNRYAPYVTVEVRANWPPGTPYSEICEAMYDATRDALQAVALRTTTKKDT